MTGRTRVALVLCVLVAGGRSVADDGTARAIVSTGSSAMPSWTADGSHLVFHSRRKEAKQHGIAARNIWIVGADGSGERQLTKGTKDEYHPVVSPDGKKLLFVSELNGSRDVWIADADGQNAVPLTDDPGTEDQPAWSPDGRTLAFQHRGEKGWEIWTLALPADIATGERLRLAQQVRGGADVDTAKLRSGDTLRGTLGDARFRLRTAYGAVELPREVVTTIIFDTGERGLARVVLANGDALSGFLENETIHLAAGGRSQGVPVEGIAQLSLRAAGRGGAGPPAPFRALLRNGDSVRVTAAFAPLRLRVGGRTMEVSAAEVERVDFTEAGNKADVALRSGDRVSGEVVGERLPLVLASGAHLSVHPSSLRALERAGGP